MPNLTDKPNYRVLWSQEDLARMADMLAGGHTIPEIAKVMGRSQEAVRNRATSAGLMKQRKFRAPRPAVDKRYG
jgi:hypothetical protein